jgi:hypothetical protein
MIYNRINAPERKCCWAIPSVLPKIEALLTFPRAKCFNSAGTVFARAQPPSTSLELSATPTPLTPFPSSYQPTTNNPHSLSTLIRHNLNKLPTINSSTRPHEHASQSRHRCTLTLSPRDGASPELHALREDKARGPPPCTDPHTLRAMTDASY